MDAESLNLISDRKCAAQLLTRPAEQRGGLGSKGEKKYILLKTAALHVLSPTKVTGKKKKKKVLNLCTEGPAGTGPERYPQGQFLPEPSSVQLQITQRCPSHQSRTEGWSQTEGIANKEQLSLFSWSRGGGRGGTRSDEDGVKHTPGLSNQKSDRPEMLSTGREPRLDNVAP